jgi:Fibronectin type III domain
MRSVNGTAVRRATAIGAAFALLGVYQWAGGGQFGPTAESVDPNRPTPRGGHVENEFGDRLIRDDEFYRQRAYPNDEVPPGALEDAWAQAALLPVVSETRSLPTADDVVASDPLSPDSLSEPDAFGLPASATWSQVGTRGITGYTNPFDDFYNGTVPLSGRIVAIANHPSDPNTAYIGSPSGGLFKTTNGGTSWTPLFDAQTTLSISAIAIDPDAPDTVYVGTGEGSGGRYYGQGVFKSTNGGATWTKLSIGSPGTALDYCHVSDVVALPGNNRVIVTVSSATLGGPASSCQTSGTFAATGLWTSADGGMNWSHSVTTGATDLAVDSTDPTRIYAGDRQYGALYSSNSGDDWSSTFGLPPSDLGQAKVAAGDGDVVYAAIEKASDFTLLGIYKSTDGGVNYSLLSAPSDICNYPASTTAQCNYDFDIAVDTSPVGSDIVYLAGIFLGRSTDGGATFSYSGNDPNQQFGSKQLHVDIQKLSFDANGRLWVGTDGGIQRTSNGTTFTNLNADLNLQQFQHGISTTPAGTLFGGTQDLGSTRYTSGPGWTMWLSGDGGAGAVDPRDSQVVYGTYVFGQAFKSTDGGATNSLLNLDDCMGEGTSACLFYAPFEMDPARPDTIFTATNEVYRTTDGWATQPFSISAAFSNPISAIAPAASDENVIYAGDIGGELRVTSDAGITNTWPVVSGALPARWITDILVDPRDADHAWVSFSGFGSGHVYETYDRGGFWFDVSGNLPDAPVNAIDADFRTAPANLFVGTDVGVFASDDGGANWARYGTGLPQITTLDVVVNSAQNTLTAGTSGRGMWTVPIGCSVPNNDLFANADTLTGHSDSDVGDNTCASTEFGEPRHNPDPGDPLPSNSLWWNWTSPGNGTVEIDTFASAGDTVLAVYSGDSIGSLTQLAQNDDAGSGLQSQVSLPVTEGTTYRIAVDGYNTFDAGAVTVNLDATVSPSAPLNATTTPGNGEVTVSWDAASANGSPVVAYGVSASPGTGSCGTAGATSCTIDGLTNGTEYTFSITASNANGTSNAATVTGTPGAEVIVALAPGRVYETRSAPNVTVDGQQTAVGRTTAGEVVEVDVAGRAGVPNDADAAVLNITAIRPTTGGFITSFPCGTTQPLTASLNYAAGQVIANGAIIKLGTTGTNTGKVCIYTSSAMDLVVDVTGYVPDGSVLGALAPGRVYETRSAPNVTIDGQQTALGRTTAGEVVEVEVAGRAGVPTGADSAIINITAIRPTTGGFITSFPCGTTQPLTASLNYAAGQVIANGAIIKLGTTGTNTGKVCIYTSSAMDLVVDVTGYIPVTTGFGALSPGRIYETRSAPNVTVDGQQTAVGRTTAGEVVEVDVAGRAGVPNDADAAVLNITAIRPTTGGFITSFPCGTTQPLTASLNYAAGQVIANGAIIKLGTTGTNTGKVCIYTSSAMDLVVDVTGYVSG